MRKLYKEKQIRTYVSYFFIVLISAITAIIVYHEFKIVPFSEINNDSKNIDLEVLTNEEIDAERQKFLPLLYSPKISESSSFVDAITTYYASDEDASQALTVIKERETIGNVNKSQYNDLTMTSETTESDGSIIRSYSSSDNTLVAINEYSTNDLSSLVIEGSIIAIDNNKKTVTVALRDNTGMGKIQLNPKTKILINNKPIDFLALKIADTVRAEGFGDSTSNILNKTNIIIITGFHQVISTI
jgi:hypothetical protein